jgi:hypothetical protein
VLVQADLCAATLTLVRLLSVEVCIPLYPRATSIENPTEINATTIIKGMLRLGGAKFINTGEQQYVCAVMMISLSCLLSYQCRFWGATRRAC